MKTVTIYSIVHTYEDGYAAACSSRYDIMSSELVLEEDCV